MCDRRPKRPLVAAALACLALAACSGESAHEATPGVLRDVDRLRLLLIQDPARQPLEEAERVAVDRPVEAARRLRSGGIPGARAQLAAAEGLVLGSDEGRRYQRRLVAAYRDRVTALEQYAEVLEGAAADQEALLEAIRAQAAVELAIMAVDADLEQLAPTARPEEPEASEQPPPEGPRPGAATR